MAGAAVDAGLSMSGDVAGGGVVDVSDQYDVNRRHFILLQRLLDIVLGNNLL